MAQNWSKKHNKRVLCKGQNSLGHTTPQKPEVGLRSGPYLLVLDLNVKVNCKKGTTPLPLNNELNNEITTALKT